MDDTKFPITTLYIIKITISENERKNKQSRCILFEELLLLKSNTLRFDVFGKVSN